MCLSSTNLFQIFRCLAGILPVFLLSAFASCKKAKNASAPSIHKNAYQQQAYDLFQKGMKYYNSGNDTLLFYGNQLVDLGKKYGDDEVLIQGKLLRANYEWRSGSYLTGMREALEALEIAEQYNYTQNVPALYRIVGNLHKENENYLLALQAATRGIEAARQIKDTPHIILLMLNRAMFTHSYGMLKNDAALRKKGLNYHLEGLSLAEADPKFERLRIPYFNNIAQYYKIAGDYQKGLFYGKKAESLAKKYGQDRSLTYTYNWLGEIYFEKGNYQKGIAYLNKALAISIELNLPYREGEMYRVLSNCYHVIGNDTKALSYYARAVAIHDSLQILKNVHQIGELQIEYESEKKQQRIDALRLINSEKTRKTTAILIAMILFVLLSIFLFIQYRTIKHRNFLLAENNEKINEQSRQLQFLMKELHHRVKNNLQIVSSLLTLQSSHTTQKEAYQAVKMGQQRIEAMSLIHKSLYRQECPNLVNMKEYLAQLVESITMSFGMNKQNLDLRLDIQIETMDVDTALPMGLIINEWLTNAFKYAYSEVEHPVLRLSLKTVDGILLEIEDNGPGMSTDEWERPKDSFGIKLIKVLGRQLKGECRMEPCNGTKFILQIP